MNVAKPDRSCRQTRRSNIFRIWHQKTRLSSIASPLVITAILTAFSQFSAGAADADWPTFRGDAARTGFVDTPLPDAVALRWSYDASPPTPAWPRSGRMPFDRAYHSVIKGDQVFFASSTDHSLYRLNLKTGEGGVIHTTDGPLRFAPTIWKDRLLLPSDDGFLYCLSFDGEVIWKHRGGPGEARRLGNEQLISKWPARGAPAVVGDTVYYAAGIWPSDEIFVYALDCATGAVRWVNDDSGGIEMPQPHGGADAESGVSAQGYLVVSSPDGTNVPFASDEESSPRLLVPTGRAVPASFDLGDGKFQYFHLQAYGQKGGFATMAVGPMFFNSGIAFDAASGKAGETIGAGPFAAFPGGLVRGTEKQVAAYRWVEQNKADRRGKTSQVWGLEPAWTSEDVDCATTVIVAGDTIVAGGDGVITLLDRTSGAVKQRLKVNGAVYGLSASDGHLIASTDSGQLFCFSGNVAPSASQPIAAKHHQRSSNPNAYADNPVIVAAADKIAAGLASKLGYCLDFGCGDGELAYQIAKRTEMKIYAIDDDADRVQTARQKLLSTGLYGSRVTVHLVQDLQKSQYPNYFANLIVSGRSLADPDADFLATGWQACQRPYGGVAMFGPADKMRVVERGPLEKAGQWTHQYMSAANQLCSTDEMVQGPLGMLWYRDVDVDLPQRHGRGPAPLFYDGLLYHEGINEIVCVDAYNGTEVWRYSLPGILKAFDGDELMGVSGTGSNYCVGDTGVYIRLEDHCLRLNRRTGELLGKFTAPLQTDGQPGTWGYLALEHGRLFGTLANRDHLVTFRYRATTGDMKDQLTESSTLFALDPESGEVKWRFDAKDSIRHNAIAIGDDQVFLIDRPLALYDRNREKPNEQQPTGVLIALDVKTGEEQWRNDKQIDGTTLSLSPEYRKLLMSYQPTRFSLASEIGGRLTVFATDKGEMTWTKQATYSSRPLINDYTVYAQGGAWDLLNGDEKPFNFGRSYGCGVLAGSRHMMVYRSATLGYFDLLKNEKTENYGGMRPGCWLNALPAGGLVLVPDASAGCACSYLNQSWVALEPVGIRPPTIVPSGGAFGEAVAVDIQHDDRSVVVRYTLDGSSPGIDSPKYEGPLTIPASAKLRARAFAGDGQLSRASNAEFLIERDLLPLEDSKWQVWDLSGNVHSAPSKWSVEKGVVHQRSNIYFGSATDANPDVERYGTLRFFTEGKDFTDGVIEFEIRSGDDDGIGLAFRAADEKRNYLWSTDLQRKFRILAVKDGDRFEVLAKNEKTYQKGVWQQVRIELDGPRITIFVDGEEDFSVTDQTFASGTIALHSWGSDSVEFRRLKMRAK